MSSTVIRPPFDPEIEAALTARAHEVITALHPEGITELRRRVTAPDPAALTRDGTYAVSEHRVPVAWDGAEVVLVLVRPVLSPGPVPVLYFLHGGGMVVGSAYDDLPAMLDLAERAGMAIAALEYRLAPESPFPAPVEDCHAGLVWLADNGAQHGLDPSRVVISGVSAGGGLAAATALLARERGGPGLVGQLLIYPMLDDRNETQSALQMAGVGAWDRTANATGWQAYLGDLAGGPDVPPSAAPARESDLAGLPPAFIDVGSTETFRDEDISYAQQLWRCGGEAELHVWPGGCHGFDFLAPEAVMSKDARAVRARWLLRVLSRAAGPTGPPDGVGAETVSLV